MARNDDKLTCDHDSEHFGYIEYPPNPPLPLGDGPHAATNVCDRPTCREDGHRWVENRTGHRGEYIPFRSKR